MWRRVILVFILFFWVGAGQGGIADDAVEAVSFNRDIRPLFSETCFRCHGPDEHARQAGLRLDTPEGATVDLGGYQPFVAGDLQASEAWQRIITDDPDMLMPPPESHLVLTEQHKSLIARWIEQGAQYEGHWAFAAPVQPPVPRIASRRKPSALPVSDDLGSLTKNEIDAFIINRLQDAMLSPSPEADPRILIRRLSFDLIGLPPTRDEVHRFIHDYRQHGETAYQDAVTRLLASPHFGERMAVPWMDQARYADTNGYSIDGGRHMWLWRDWVIQAYNENMPFDEFLIKQLAGDLLPDATEADRVASGFNRNHMITHEGGTIPLENLTNYTVDRVKTTSEVFLGLTMACAQCHDHKYDPISQKEYYQFFAFFNELGDAGLAGDRGINAAPAIRASTVLPQDELPALREELASLKEELATTTQGFEEWIAKARADEASRGEGFRLHGVEMLDATSPNIRGAFSIQDDTTLLQSQPGGGVSAFSHSMRLLNPAPRCTSQTGQGRAGRLPNSRPRTANTIAGIRISFLPYQKNDEKPPVLTPFSGGVPKVTTVLVSADDQPSNQVDFYSPISFAQVTASSTAQGHSVSSVRDERNLEFWQPSDAATEQHLTLTFAQPIDPDQTPYLSILLVFGVHRSNPYHWKIEAFCGKDSDSVFSDSVAKAIAKPDSQWAAGEREQVMAAFRAQSPQLESLRIRIANLSERVDVLTQKFPTMVMNTAAKPRQTFVLARGQYDAPQEKVEPATPGVLPPLPMDNLREGSQTIKTSSQANRLDLAQWMIAPNHPLTSRVAVNRIWSLFFGKGIVTTTADLGSQGSWPSHPELLDYLATTFQTNGWNQKKLIRQIVSSATYRQDASVSSEARKKDPENILLGRGPRFRLPAEFIRDQALAISELLVPRIGGPSVRPYQPVGLWKEVSHFGSTPATEQTFVQDHGEKLYRRSLYTFTKRTSPHPVLSAFDAPNREMCIVQRSVTNTPLQALVTLNEIGFAETARVFAAKLLQSTAQADDNERLSVAFERITSRLPNENEQALLREFLQTQKAVYQQEEENAHQVVSIGESKTAADLDVSTHAAWTQVVTLIFNLSETITRN